MWWTIKGYIVYQKKILPDTCEKCFGINHGGKLDKGSGLTIFNPLNNYHVHIRFFFHEIFVDGILFLC